MMGAAGERLPEPTVTTTFIEDMTDDALSTVVGILKPRPIYTLFFFFTAPCKNGFADASVFRICQLGGEDCWGNCRSVGSIAGAIVYYFCMS